MATTETTRSLYVKLCEVMDSVQRIPKRGRNDFHKYDYAMEADIVEAVRSELASRNVMIMPSIKSVERDGTLTVVMMDFTFVDGETGETHTSTWAGYGDDKGDKGLYKALTGAVKYLIMKTWLMPTGDDPESDTGTDQRNILKRVRRDASPAEPRRNGARREAERNTDGGVATDGDVANGQAAPASDPYESEEAFREAFRMEPDEEDLLRIEQNQIQKARIAMMGTISRLCSEVPDVVKDIGFSPKTLPKWGKLTDAQKEEKRRFLSEICGLPGGYNEGTSRQWREAEARLREKYLPPA